MNTFFFSCIRFAFIIHMFPAVCSGTGPEVKLLLSVKDNDGRSIRNAQIVACFSRLTDPTDPWKGQTSDKVTVLTDMNGKCEAVGNSLHEMTVVARKDGYYESRETLHNSKVDRQKGQWVPYELEVNIVMRKIINPVPMYAWSMHLNSYPVKTNEWAGYDMLRAEWMPPHGNGKTEDVRFHVWRSTNGYDRTQPSQILTARFMGEKNGVCGIDDHLISAQSWLKFPYNAPRDGYTEEEFRVERRLALYEFETKTNTGTTNCFFRIRSKTDKDGNFIEGLYGKFRGPLEVDGGKNIRIKMIYYVNPTPNDLNMEFDPKKNLINKMEVVKAVSFP